MDTYSIPPKRKYKQGRQQDEPALRSRMEDLNKQVVVVDGRIMGISLSVLDFLFELFPDKFACPGGKHAR